jgi:hypothetical protein
MTSSQATFDFDSPVIANAMQRSDDNADPDWRTVFDQCIISVARKMPELTSDDALDEYEALCEKPFTHNLSAIGPAMLRAAKDGVLVSTGRVQRSTRPLKHGIRHTIWRSNVYRGAA